MNIEITKKLSVDKQKFWYTFEWGKGAGERKAAGVFTYAKAAEYLKLLQTPIYNNDIKDAFIVCCYNGLRWCDIKALKWKSVLNDKTIFEIVQAKTDVVVPVTMRPVVQEIIGKRMSVTNVNPNKRVFDLPSATSRY